MKQKILILAAIFGVGIAGLLLGVYMPKFQASFKTIAEEKSLINKEQSEIHSKIEHPSSSSSSSSPAVSYFR